MEITAALELLKKLPENLSTVTILAVLLFTFLNKSKEIDSKNVISISELQTNQMTQLIAQNAALAKELHSVRLELQNAYAVINDMRSKIVELEELVKRKEK
jgi:hypothetical protein